MDAPKLKIMIFFSLFYHSHPIWGSLTIVFILLGFLAALLAVLIGRIQRGDPMPFKKCVLLSVVALTSTFEAFFESGPQMVIICVEHFSLKV